MFKQILKTTIFIIIIIIIIIKIINYYLIKNHKLYITDSIVKYNLDKKDELYMKKYTTKVNINEIKENCIFYTTEKWSTKNNNYILFKDRYYIIEPGYYYYIHKDTKLFFNNISVYKLN